MKVRGFYYKFYTLSHMMHKITQQYISRCYIAAFSGNGVHWQHHMFLWLCHFRQLWALWRQTTTPGLY